MSFISLTNLILVYLYVTCVQFSTILDFYLIISMYRLSVTKGKNGCNSFKIFFKTYKCSACVFFSNFVSCNDIFDSSKYQLANSSQMKFVKIRDASLNSYFS